MKYPLVSIGELASSETGAYKIGPFGSSLKKEELVNNGIPVVGIENVLKEDFSRPFRRYITDSKYKELKDYTIQPNDILVTTMGTIGKAAVVPDKIETMIMDSHLFRMRVDTKRVLPLFITFAFNGYSGLIDQLNRKARGAIMDGLNTSILKECLLPLPPIDVQKRIIIPLQKADRVRRLRWYARELSDGYLQSVFLEMFGDPETNPMGWKKESLDRILIDTQNGYSQRSDFNEKGTIVLRIRDVGAGFIDYSDPRRMVLEPPDEETYKLDEGDLLFVRVNGNPELVGRVAVFKDLKERIIFSDHIIRAKIKKDIILPDYLTEIINSGYGRQQIRKVVITTAGQFTINRSGLSAVHILYPPIALQKRFVDHLGKFKVMQNKLNEASRQAEQLFQSLLREAFEG